MNRTSRSYAATRPRPLAEVIDDIERRLPRSADDPSHAAMLEKLRRLRAVQAWRNEEPER